MKLFAQIALFIICFLPVSAGAQDTLPETILQLRDQTGNPETSSRIIQSLVLLAVLTVVPGLLIMATSFTRILVALSFLRSSIGLPSTPANIVLLLLALFLTFFIMSPTIEKAYRDGIKPYSENQIEATEAYANVTGPFRDFILRNVREKELAFFSERAAASGLGDDVSQSDFRILAPAFLISELRRGFEIGFLIALPFLVIDIVVATVTMSMGMMMLPPTVISLPFKVLFFILIDGWALLAGSLIDSFA
jgi:flagellar biosynthesis protein FliP